MEILNATAVIAPAPDSPFRLLACGCGNDQPVYLIDTEGRSRVHCLDCGTETDSFERRHDAQRAWNMGGVV